MIFTTVTHSIDMRKIFLKSCILAGLCSAVILFGGWKNSTLKDITKPYLGEYECTQATLGDVDYLKEMKYIRLMLQKGDEFILSYCPQDKAEQTLKGSYKYDKDKQIIVLKLSNGMCFERAFPIKKGEIYITVPIGALNLRLIFEQK